MPGYNHYPWCTCGWCYKSGLNGFSRRIPTSALEKDSALRKLATLGVTRSWTACFIRPTPCPVCGATVFYYQNVHGSRVFFNELGGTWPKHECTDRRRRQVSTHASVPATIVLRSLGEVQEIAELLGKAEHDAGAEYTDRYRELPPILYKVQEIFRHGFENFIEAQQVAPAYAEPLYLSFTSSKVTPTAGDLFSLQADQVSVFDWAGGLGRRFKYREITKELWTVRRSAGK